ncbi:MAG: efflux transporter periplasmic adaptor subunit [Zetaproteobacteria bacterium CG1_02_49_23]|nr:MAG: efflux transporter periplasmic adaptor subunit [Zetaproteobacteria bacterium CG1_02_49_23]
MMHAMLVTGLILVLAACSGPKEPAVNSATPQQVQAHMITVNEIELPEHYVTSGTVTSDHSVAISSRISGYIRKLSVREGDRVEAGQVLVQVDPVDARQAFIQAKAEMVDAEADFQRYSELMKVEAVTRQQLARVELRYKQAKSKVEQARNQLSYAEVRSPVAGVVVDKRLSEGDLASPGLTIVVIEDPSSLLVETYVSEQYVRTLHEEDVVDVNIPALNQTFNGHVRQIVQAADPVTHQFFIKVALPSDKDVHPGMYAQTGFRIGVRNSVMVPEAALVTQAGLHAVYVLDAQQVAHYRQIRLGAPVDGQLEVLAGLHAGDVIAWKEAGATPLQSGMKVLPVAAGQ